MLQFISFSCWYLSVAYMRFFCMHFYVFAAYMLIKITPLFLLEEIFFIENAGESQVREEFCIIGVTAQYTHFPIWSSFYFWRHLGVLYRSLYAEDYYRKHILVSFPASWDRQVTKSVLHDRRIRSFPGAFNILALGSWSHSIVTHS